MATLKLTETVNAPSERVFEVFSNFPQAAENVDGIKSVEMLTDGPVGVGTRFKETRVMFGKEATEEMEVSRFEPNQLYTVSAESCGAKFDTTFHFVPKSERQTEVEMEMNIQSVTMFAKLMSPLSFLMRGTMKKCLMADVDDLKRLCESE